MTRFDMVPKGSRRQITRQGQVRVFDGAAFKEEDPEQFALYADYFKDDFFNILVMRELSKKYWTVFNLYAMIKIDAMEKEVIEKHSYLVLLNQEIP